MVIDKTLWKLVLQGLVFGKRFVTITLEMDMFMRISGYA